MSTIVKFETGIFIQEHYSAQTKCFIWPKMINDLCTHSQRNNKIINYIIDNNKDKILLLSRITSHLELISHNINVMTDHEYDSHKHSNVDHIIIIFPHPYKFSFPKGKITLFIDENKYWADKFTSLLILNAKALIKTIKYETPPFNPMINVIRMQNIEYMLYLFGMGYSPSLNTFYFAVKKGRLNMVKLVYEYLDKSMIDDIFKNKTLSTAAENGGIRMLKFLHDNGFKMTHETVMASLSSFNRHKINYPPLLDFFKNTIISNRWNAVFAVALHTGTMEVLKWFKIKFPKIVDKLVLYLEYLPLENEAVCKWVSENLKKPPNNEQRQPVHESLKNGDLQSLLISLIHGYNPHPDDMIQACKIGSFEIISVLYKFGGDRVINEEAGAEAVRNGDIKLLEYLITKGYKFHYKAGMAAVEKVDNCEKILNLLKLNGVNCMWERIANEAAKYNNISALQWIKSNCPEVMSFAYCKDTALRKGNPDVVEWIDTNTVSHYSIGQEILIVLEKIKDTVVNTWNDNVEWIKENIHSQDIKSREEEMKRKKIEIYEWFQKNKGISYLRYYDVEDIYMVIKILSVILNYTIREYKPPPKFNALLIQYREERQFDDATYVKYRNIYHAALQITTRVIERTINGYSCKMLYDLLKDELSILPKTNNQFYPPLEETHILINDDIYEILSSLLINMDNTEKLIYKLAEMVVTEKPYILTGTSNNEKYNKDQIYRYIEKWLKNYSYRARMVFINSIDL